MIFKRLKKKITGERTNIKPRGEILIKNGVTGEVLIHEKNLVVNTSREILTLLAGAAQANKEITNVKVGTGTTPASLSDTDLMSAVIISGTTYYKAKTATTYPSSTSVKFEFELNSTEANDNLLTEFGLFDDDDTLFSRVVTAGTWKDATVTSLLIYWTISFE